MIGRRSFLGALAGMPIAAVVQPKVSAPEVSAPPMETVEAFGRRYFDNGSLRPIDACGRKSLTVTISCDTSEMHVTADV